MTELKKIIEIGIKIDSYQFIIFQKIRRCIDRCSKNIDAKIISDD